MVLDHSCSAPGPWSGSTGEVCLLAWLLSLLLLLLSLLPPLPFIHRPYICTLPHSRSPTHPSHSALFLKGATPLLQQWQLQMQETRRQNYNPLLFHWSRWCGSNLDFQWVMLTKKPQFASSAETRWQVILLKFPVDGRYKLLWHHVVNKCFKFDNVVWYIVNKGQILYYRT